MLRSILTASGVPVDEVNIIQVGTSGPTVARMLTENEIEACAAGIPDFAALRANGIELTDITPSEFGRVPAGTFAVTPEIKEEYGDVLGNFLRAYAKATYIAQQNPDAAKEILRHAVPEDWEDPDIVRGLMEELLRIAESGDRRGGLDPAIWENVISHAVEGGTLEEPIPVEDVISDEYLDIANDWEPADVQPLLDAWMEENMASGG